MPGLPSHSQLPLKSTSHPRLLYILCVFWVRIPILSFSASVNIAFFLFSFEKSFLLLTFVFSQAAFFWGLVSNFTRTPNGNPPLGAKAFWAPLENPCFPRAAQKQATLEKRPTGDARVPAFFGHPIDQGSSATSAGCRSSASASRLCSTRW